MPHITLTDDQAKIVSEATESIEIRDATGRHVGYIAHGFTDEDLAIAKQRMESDEPRYTTKQVVEHLRSVEQR